MNFPSMSNSWVFKPAGTPAPGERKLRPKTGERRGPGGLPGGGTSSTGRRDPALAGATAPLTPRLPPLAPPCDVTRRKANESGAYWQAAPAAAAKGEVSWGWSDGPGLEPAAAAAATTTSTLGAAAAAAGARAGVAAGVEAAGVSCRESPEHFKLWAGALQVG